MKKLVFFITMLLVLTMLSFARVEGQERYTGDVRSLGMGGTVMGVGLDMNVLRSNVAELQFLPRGSFQLCDVAVGVNKEAHSKIEDIYDDREGVFDFIPEFKEADIPERFEFLGRLGSYASG
jgi:hypothetical protein